MRANYPYRAIPSSALEASLAANSTVEGSQQLGTESITFFKFDAPDFCSSMVGIADYYLSVKPESHRIPLWPYYNMLFGTYRDLLRKLAEHHEGFSAAMNACRGSFEVDAFINVYNAEDRFGADYSEVHIDDSDCTVSMCIGGSFSDSDVRFFREGSVALGPDAVHQEANEHDVFSYSHRPGFGIVHSGRLPHCVLPIREGKRYNLILWMRPEHRPEPMLPSTSAVSPTAVAKARRAVSIDDESGGSVPVRDMNRDVLSVIFSFTDAATLLFGWLPLSRAIRKAAIDALPGRRLDIVQLFEASRLYCSEDHESCVAKMIKFIVLHKGTQLRELWLQRAGSLLLRKPSLLPSLLSAHQCSIQRIDAHDFLRLPLSMDSDATHLTGDDAAAAYESLDRVVALTSKTLRHFAADSTRGVTGALALLAPDAEVYTTNHATLSVFVRSLTCRTTTLKHLTPDCTVYDVKCAIKAHLDIDTDAQRLIFRGRRLEDNFKIGLQYDITDESTLYVVMRLKGGGTGDNDDNEQKEAAYRAMLAQDSSN